MPSAAPSRRSISSRHASPESLLCTMLLWWTIARPQILAMVFGSTMTYASVFTNELHFFLPFIAVYDWFCVNFTNKVTDIVEDLRNGIPGAELVAKQKTAMEIVLAVMIVGGLLAGHFVFQFPLSFTAARVFFTLVGLGYNLNIVPVVKIFDLKRQTRATAPTAAKNNKRKKSGKESETTTAATAASSSSGGGGRGGLLSRVGLSRFKEMYFFKNLASAVLFILSVFVYPVLYTSTFSYPTRKLVLAILFFIPLELTYEIIYDLRDVDGDRAEGVPTYPVVHGVKAAKTIIYFLLIVSASSCVFGATTGYLERKEWLVVLGTLQQLLLMVCYCGGDRLPTSQDTTRITWLGSVPLLLSNGLMQIPEFRKLILES